MEQAIKAYVDEFTQLLSNVEVTSDRKESMRFAQGVQRSIQLMRERSSRGGKIIFIGNGGSASIASHFALDFWHAGRMRSITFSDSALLTCMSNDLGFEEVYARPLAFWADPEDVLVAISSSGRSPNILKAVSAARQRGCQVVTLSGFAADNRLRGLGDLNFYVSSQRYGMVESIHKTVLHAILDISIDTRDNES